MKLKIKTYRYKHIKTMSSTFECQICCADFVRTTRKATRSLSCPRCAYEVCYTCQTSYAKGDCANCHYDIPKSVIVSSLGKQFYEHIVVPCITQKLMVEQHVNLESVDVQAEIDYLQQCKEIRNRSRFGTRLVFPPKPVKTGTVISSKFMCPINDCRGIVMEGVCNVCKSKCCAQCRNPIDPNAPIHTCDKDARMIVATSKPCPKCYTLIQLTEGCMAMRCTSCGVRFDWVTLMVTESNSNNHYNTFINNNTTRANTETGDDFCIFSNVLDRIPKDVIDTCVQEASETFAHEVVKCPPSLIYFLYNVTRAVRTYKKNMFNEADLAITLNDATHNLRVKYLMKDINLKLWTKSVYLKYTQYTAHMLHADIVNTYLSITDGLQSELRNNIVNNAPSSAYIDMGTRLAQLSEMCNQSFIELHENHPIRNAPFFIRNYIESANSSDDSVDCGFITTSRKRNIIAIADIDKIQLYAYQVSHIANMRAILDRSHYAMDLSPLGSGKTYTTMKTYLERGFSRGIIIAPASVVGKWSQLVAKFGLPNIEIYSFNELAGTGMRPGRASHLVTRADIDRVGATEVRYKPTPQLEQYIRTDGGLCVIIDEFQNIKNSESAQTIACKCLVSAVYREYARSSAIKSRAILISGSPVDKYQHTIQFFKTVGVMTHAELVRFNIGEFRARGFHNYTLTGLLEIQNHCRRISNARMIELENIRYAPNARNRDNHVLECYQYFTDIVVPFRSCSMTVSETNFSVKKYNGIYPLASNSYRNANILNPDEHRHNDITKLFNNGIELLRRAISRRDENGNAMDMVVVLACIQKGLVMVETSKIPLFIQLVREGLSKNPQHKVVLSFNYSTSVKDAVRELAEFSPLVLTGSVPSSARQNIISQFQTPDTTNRLLIGNTHVLSSGIDLDDKHGGFPRTCFVSPNYHTIDMYQITHRFLRGLDTRSNSKVYVIYVSSLRDKCAEMGVLKSLIKKGGIMKDVSNAIPDSDHTSNSAHNVFTCDYTDYVPPEKTGDEWKMWDKQCMEIFERCKV